MLALVASNDADADVAPPPDIYSTHRATIAPLALPPEPPLPAGCVKPTALNCADSAWLASDACAKDPGKSSAIRSLCTWTLLKAWNDASATIDPTMFPKSAPNAVYPPALMAPAQRVDHGKRLDAQPSSRPGEKRRFPGMAPHGQIGVKIPSPTTLSMTPKVARGGGGSFATTSASHIVTSLDRVHREVGTFRGVPVKNIGGNRQLTDRANATSTLLLDRPSFVSNGDGVTSCEDYAYKRWGDYSRFAFGAKRLGRNYRAAYNMATDPRSPTFINKTTLNQIGTGVTPRQISDVFRFPTKLPVNPFIGAGVGWLDNVASITDGKGKPLITDLQKATIKALVAQPHSLQSRTDTTPLGIHREMKALFDSKYDPLDEELDDISKRTSTYLSLLNQRASMVVEAICTGPTDPCHRCSPWPPTPSTMPPGLQGLRDGVSGPAIVNPADLKDRFRDSSKYGQLSAVTQIGKVAGAVSNFRAGSPGAGGGMKQKAPPVIGQMNRGGPQPQLPPIKPPPGQPQFGPPQTQCMRELGAKHAQVSGAMTEIERQLTRLLVNELAFKDRGCLADPGGALGNLCDCSYQTFALTMSTLFDPDVERDLQECRAHISTNAAMVTPTPPPATRAFPTVVKSPPNQHFVFPCTQRRDFSANAASLFSFIELENNEWMGRQCEADVQNATVLKQQDAIHDQMTGVQWDPAAGKLFDRQHDSQGIGDASTLGASFTYDSYWDMRRTGEPKNGDTMKSCRFVGSAYSNADAKIQIFGSELSIFKLDGATTSEPSPNVSITAQYLDIDTMSQHEMTPKLTNKPLAPGEVYSVAFEDPPINLGGIEYSFWFTIGPIPIHVVFGAVATAGVDYHLEGAVGDNCADLAKSSGFKLVAEAKPYARADAYADASVDIGVADAGVRLDLNLLNLSIPIGVNVSSSDSGYQFTNGGHVAIDMLSGHLSAYADVGVSPFDVSYNANIFGWDGVHVEIPIFGASKQFSQDVVRIAMAARVTAGSASCKCTATECCSNVTCKDIKAPAICSGTKVIEGENYACSFNAADFAAISKIDPGGAHLCRKYVNPPPTR